MLDDSGHRRKVRFVRRDVLANGRGRWLAIAASVAVSAAMFQAQSALDHPGNHEPAISGDGADFLEDWHAEFLLKSITRAE